MKLDITKVDGFYVVKLIDGKSMPQTVYRCIEILDALRWVKENKSIFRRS